jgi:hypothetical protein
MKLYADLHPTRQAALFSPAEMTPGDFKKKKSETEVGKTDTRNNGCINLNRMGGGITTLWYQLVIQYNLEGYTMSVICVSLSFVVTWSLCCLNFN